MTVKHFVSVLGLLLLAGAAQAQTLDPAKIKSRNVAYVSHKHLKAFPTPILMYLNDKPQHERLKKEVVERIIYPMLCESAEPIAVVVVDFCPEIYGTDERGCKDEMKGKLTIMVEIRRQGGSGFMSMIDTNLEGNFADDIYLTLFTGGYQEYVPRNKGCKVRKVERQK
jgi:hypothetical protein